MLLNWEHEVLEIDGREIKCRVPLLSEVPTVEVKAVKSYSIPAPDRDGHRGAD